MLILSTFNYVNIATVMATKRIKEIGVRKVIGGRRSQLIMQFLIENFILCLLAMSLGVLLAAVFFLPQFSIISGLDISLDLLTHKNLWKFLGGLLLVITLVSGAYPAFFISSFKPVAIFRNASGINKKRRFTSVLLTFQFILAMITIVAGIIFVKSYQASENMDWGYDQHDKIVVFLYDNKQFQQLKDDFLQNSKVVDIAGSQAIIGRNYNTETVIVGDNEAEQVSMIMGEWNYPELMGFQLKSGKFFNPNQKDEAGNSILVNESFMSRIRGSGLPPARRRIGVGRCRKVRWRSAEGG